MESGVKSVSYFIFLFTNQ